MKHIQVLVWGAERSLEKKRHKFTALQRVQNFRQFARPGGFNQDSRRQTVLARRVRQEIAGGRESKLPVLGNGMQACGQDVELARFVIPTTWVFLGSSRLLKINFWEPTSSASENVLAFDQK